MKVFLYINDFTDITVVKKMISYLRNLNINIISNLYNSIEQKEKANALIIHGDKLHSEDINLIFSSLYNKQKVLCLISDGVPIDGRVEKIKANKALKNNFFIYIYNKDNLEQKIIDFIKILDKDSVRDQINIKYTLRITSKIGDYLNWKAKEVKMPKADWLRQEIKEMMQKDVKYKKFLEGKFDVKKD